MLADVNVRITPFTAVSQPAESMAESSVAGYGEPQPMNEILFISPFFFCCCSPSFLKARLADNKASPVQLIFSIY